MTKKQILEKFSLLSAEGEGIVGWLSATTDDIVFNRLSEIDTNHLSAAQLNQLLTLSHEAPASEDFFRYYWLTASESHPYNVRALPGFQEDWLKHSAIVSIDHLYWGLYRLFVDGLLYFGNIRTGYRSLRDLSKDDLSNFFVKRSVPTGQLRSRGPALPLMKIPHDDRYLISEMACKSYGEDGSPGDLRGALIEAYRDHIASGGKSVSIGDLLNGKFIVSKHQTRQAEFQFSADDVLKETVGSEEELVEKISKAAQKFTSARTSALENTRHYLSMVGNLDVYVATSMRTRQDFRSMGTDCDKIFTDPKLASLNLRYFDPTLSAAAGHEDKGIIECLMVKCAKSLVYCAGERDSYGKDAEAAMALSQGKPVIIFCTQDARARFFRDVHPLSRLIELGTGVAVGAMVTDKIADVIEILYRVFENKMEYELEQPKPGYFKLKEKITDSVVRLQTNDRLLAETFWNYYHTKGFAQA